MISHHHDDANAVHASFHHEMADPRHSNKPDANRRGRDDNSHASARLGIQEDSRIGAGDYDFPSVLVRKKEQGRKCEGVHPE